jgi:energy-coupling factor transporter ATP-binding protein EcfA2
LADVDTVPRRDFVEDFGRNYHPGQHVTFLGPSGRGKTRLAGQLLLSVRKHHPEITAVLLHGKIKGRDSTIEQLSKASGYPIVTHWPPRGLRARRQMKNSRGVIVRPLERPEGSVKEENALLAKEYKSAIHRGYHAPRKAPVIIVADEAHQTHNDLKLMQDCEGPLMRGRPVCGMWSLVQRGRYVSYHVYDQAEHVFIFYDPDRDNQKRYSEIGDVDPKELVDLTRNLQTHSVKDGSTISEALYFRRSGNKLVIVGT